MARTGFSLGAKAGGGGQVKTITVTIAQLGALVAWIAGTIKLTMPETGKIVGMTLNAAAKGGTFSTAALDVQDDGVSLLASTFDVAALVAGTPVNKEASSAFAAGAASVAKDSVISIIATESGGSSPTLRGMVLQIDYVPLGD